jgi:UDP-glucose 4-epimerase
VKVLIYGANGFIGRCLAQRLTRDAEVLTFDRKPYLDTTFLGNIKDAEAVSEAMVECDRWVNLAGLLGTAELIRRPQDAVDVNITGAVNVFEAAALHGKPGLQIAVGNYWMLNPYSISKTCAERLALMYNHERGTDIRVVRAMNVYGPGQKVHPVRKLLPNVIVPAIKGETITIYGDGEQIMDMIYVKDAVEILARILLGPKPEIDEVLEAGAGPITVNEIVNLVIDIAGGGKIERIPMRPGEMSNAVVQISDRGAARLRELIRFDVYADCTPMREAFEDTVEWYRANA